MRKGFEGLYGLVRDRLSCEPLSGHLFLFCNGQRNRLKVLVWDGSGLWVCAKHGQGTPAVIIPTITEREGNTRRLAALGAGEIVLPVDSADDEKHIDVAEFSAKVHRVLNDAGYLRSARRVAESMRKFSGAQEAAERIERFAGVRN